MMYLKTTLPESTACIRPLKTQDVVFIKIQHSVCFQEISYHRGNSKTFNPKILIVKSWFLKRKTI